MARIRTIKPDFWQDEKLAPLDPLTRLVFLGLISQADDAGRLVDNVKLLDGLLFPETDDSSRDALETLARLGRIIRYRSESGQKLIQIVNWEKHQKVDRPGKNVLPPPPPEVLDSHTNTEPSRHTRETIATPSRDNRDRTLDLGSRTLDDGPGIMERDLSSSSHAGTRAKLRVVEGGVGDEPASDDRDAIVSAIIQAANRAMAANSAIDQQRLRPIPTGHGSRQDVIDWLDAGIPPDLIREVVESRASEYRPDETHRQISTMRYFDAAVRDEYRRRTVIEEEDHEQRGHHTRGFAAQDRASTPRPRTTALGAGDPSRRSGWVYE